MRALSLHTSCMSGKLGQGREDENWKMDRVLGPLRQKISVHIGWEILQISANVAFISS